MRPIPKVLVVTTNIGQAFPELKLEIRTSFESLPAAWYCRHYGSGAGTCPWYLEDTILIGSSERQIVVPLRLNKATYCPYVLHGAFLSLNQNSENKVHDIAFIWSLKDTPNVKWDLIPQKLEINFNKDDLGYFFPDEGKTLSHYSFPSNGQESLKVEIVFRKSEKGRE